MTGAARSARRLPALLTFTVVGALLTAGFGLLRKAGLGVAVPVACLGIFACSYARVWDQSTMQVGNLLTVVLVLAMDEPRGRNEALLLAGVFAAGSLWAVLLTMVIWRIHPFRPARHAVADAYRATARLVADLRGLILAEADPAAWDAHARGHRRAVRDTIERARTAVQDTLRVRGQASARAFQGLIRVEAIDQIFGALIALSDLLEATPDPAVRAAAARLLRLLRPALRVVAEAIRADDPGRGRTASLKRLATLGSAIDTMADAEKFPALAGVTHAIIERLRIATNLTAPANYQPGALPEPAASGSRWQRFTTPLRANLNWRSASFRHALRTAVVAGPALGFTLSLHGDYQHWLTITLILTMQPFYALTWQRALERSGGTVLGGLVAAVLALVCTTPLAIAAALFPLAVLAFTARAVNYGFFIALLTPMVVLLTEFSRPGASEFVIAGYRAAYTVAGGLAIRHGGGRSPAPDGWPAIGVATRPAPRRWRCLGGADALANLDRRVLAGDGGRRGCRKSPPRRSRPRSPDPDRAADRTTGWAAHLSLDRVGRQSAWVSLSPAHRIQRARRQLHRDLRQPVCRRHDPVQRVNPVGHLNLPQQSVELGLQRGHDVCAAETHVHEPVRKAQCDVRLVAEEVAQSPRLVVHWGDEQQVPERRAVAAVVRDPLDAALARVQARSNAVRRVRIGPRPLQEAAVVADRGRLVIAGDSGEGRVDRHHRTIR